MLALHTFFLNQMKEHLISTQTMAPVWGNKDNSGKNRVEFNSEKIKSALLILHANKI